QAPGATTILHEKQGGYANNKLSLAGLESKAMAAGVRILAGTQVTGLRISGGAVTAVRTNPGGLARARPIVAARPRGSACWALLRLRDRSDITEAPGTAPPDRPMWTYWALQEGTLEVDPGAFTTSTGDFPPVVHVDSDAPLYDDIDGRLITDEMWGIYFK